MRFKPRDYQQAAIDAAKAHVTKSTTSCLLELATGSGKSIIVAELAYWLKDISGKKVLCLQPSKELVEQNLEKYLATGATASIYCASVSSKKDMTQDVVYGSPQTVSRSLEKFGSQFGAVIIDEAHRTDDTVKKVIEHMRVQNPKLRVIGLTATPYRMGSGYIYGVDMDNKTLGDDQAVNPYYGKLVYQVLAPFLIDEGYLTKPTTQITNGGYDTSGLATKSNGEFTHATIEKAFVGQGRKTAGIVEQIVNASHNRMGVMIFASTIQHANEVMESLPESKALITGELKKADRASIIAQFKSKQIKYLVNVSVLTTGFDCSHVDLVAILRATESPSLLQQIIGRGLRLDDDKDDCIVMDFAENIERHGLEDDLFKPKISTSLKSGETFLMDVICPNCNVTNEFSGRSDPDFADFEVNVNGYYIDLSGHVVETEKGQPMPAHFGRRCLGNSIQNGELMQCSYRWSSKVCEECEQDNDIAARYCSNKSCGAELIDPNQKLAEEFKKFKSDPYQKTSDKVLGWMCKGWHTQKGNYTLKVDFTTEYRTFSIWLTPDTSNVRQLNMWNDFSQAVFGEGRIAPDVDTLLAALKKGGKMPSTVTVRRAKGSAFYNVTAYNQDESVID